MIGLWLGKTNEGNGWYHTSILAGSSLIKKLHIVRYKKFDHSIHPENIVYHTFKNRGVFNNKFLNVFIKGFKVLKKERIDFIITFNVFPYGLISWVLSILFRKPLILCFVGTDYNYYLQKQPYRFFILKACKRAKIIICQGSHMITGLIGAGIEKSKLKLHPYFVSDRWFIDGETKGKEKEYDIITVGQLVKGKNIDIIILAVNSLMRSGINVNTCIIGDGSEKNSLVNMVRNLGLDHQIKFLGYQDDVLSFLHKSKIFIQTSRSEGLSIALIEALAAGIIPISTIAGSENDIIENNVNGLFIEIGNYEDLAEKIKYLLISENYNRIHGNVIREKYRFKFENAVLALDNILKEI